MLTNTIKKPLSKLTAFFVVIALFLTSFSLVFAASSILGETEDNPTGITIDPEGNIYTANLDSDNVTKITPGGVSSILGTTGDDPSGVTIDAAGNIYTANFGSNNVTKITPGGVSSILGTTGDDPYGITIDAAGNIYTANFGSNNVTKITPGGDVSTLGATGDNPTGITIDAAGNIYTANFGSNNVTKITPGGDVSTLGETGDSPAGITIDAAGNIYTANSDSDNVTKITPGGDVSTLGATGDNPTGITIDAAGNIYTANYGSNDVTKITPGGDVSTLGATGDNPAGITIDAAGNIYTANSGSNNVTKITPFTITETTPIATNTDTTPSYTFESTQVGEITYGGSCSSVTEEAVAGTNTITLNALAVGTYTDCTIQINDGGVISNLLEVSNFTIGTTSSQRRRSTGTTYGCKDTKATNYTQFASHKESLCEYEVTETEVIPEPTTKLSESNTCSLEQTLTQNLKAPSRNGTYNSYTNDIVTEAHILQAHLNQLGFNSGPEDGILGPISEGAIKDMQTFLGTDPDGYVGPLTRAFINESCEEVGLES